MTLLEIGEGGCNLFNMTNRGTSIKARWSQNSAEQEQVYSTLDCVGLVSHGEGLSGLYMNTVLLAI